MALALCTKVDSIECLFAERRCDLTLVWVGVSYKMCPKEQSGLLPQEEKVVIWFSLHGELEVEMDADEVSKEVIQFLWSIRPDHEHIFEIMEPVDGPVGRPAWCHLLKILHEEVSKGRWLVSPWCNSVRVSQSWTLK
jgi:hypothetical protein